MEPVTHALASLAVARAARKFLPRFGTSMLVTAGVAPDLDAASYFAGASAFLRFDRTLLHSLIGAAATACVVAAAFSGVALRSRRKEARRSINDDFRVSSALVVCCIGATIHLALDLASGVGVNLLWPFQTRWYGIPLAMNLDPWILLFLIAGILLPELFRLVGEEIGGRKKNARGRVGAIAALALLAGYFGARANSHATAINLLLSREYHGREPVAAGAFPSPGSPFDWRGVVSTENTLEVCELSVAPGAEFDSDRSLTYFKPEDSPALETALRSSAAKRFLAYARFPLASMERLENDYHFELRDLRFGPNDFSPEDIYVEAKIGADLRIENVSLLFASSNSH